MMKIVRYLIVLSFGYFAVASSFGQAGQRSEAINVFIDCESIDEDYLRENIPFVNYVRDKEDASLFILGSSQITGGHGRKYIFTFIGQKNFAGINDTLSYSRLANETEDEIREGQINVLKLGLIRYVSKTPQGKFIEITYAESDETDLTEDKWDNWVFNIDTELESSGEELENSINFGGSASAARITSEWRIELNLNYRLSKERFETDEEIVKTNFSSESFESEIVKSLGEHWSIGSYIGFESSTYSNKKSSYSASPAIEYNLFPYSQANQRQLRFSYFVGYLHNNYSDTTIFNKVKEDLVGQELEITFEMRDKWGTVSFGLQGFNYLNDFSKHHLDFAAYLHMRVFKGFSVYAGGELSMIHDQLALPREGATTEEILLKQKELATQYRYNFSFGISYTFGSIYNNVVNPRFGH
jgi:hypothetical protein